MSSRQIGTRVLFEYIPHFSFLKNKTIPVYTLFSLALSKEKFQDVSEKLLEKLKF